MYKLWNNNIRKWISIICNTKVFDLGATEQIFAIRSILDSELLNQIYINQIMLHHRGVFSTGAMAAILKNRPLAPAIFGHFSPVGKNCGC